MPSLELNPFTHPSAQKKEPEVKLVRKFLGPDAEKIFEKFDKSKKSDRSPDLYLNIEQPELTEQEKLIGAAIKYAAKSERLFKELLTECYAQEPHAFPGAMTVYATALIKAGRIEQAQNLINTKLPGNYRPEPSLELVRALAEREQLSEAQKVISDIRTGPERDGALLILSSKYAMQGQYELAEKMIQDMQSIQTRGDAKVAIIAGLARTGSFEEAEKQIATLYSIDKCKAYCELAVISVKNGQDPALFFEKARSAAFRTFDRNRFKTLVMMARSSAACGYDPAHYIHQAIVQITRSEMITVTEVDAFFEDFVSEMVEVGRFEEAESLLLRIRDSDYAQSRIAKGLAARGRFKEAAVKIEGIGIFQIKLDALSQLVREMARVGQIPTGPLKEMESVANDEDAATFIFDHRCKFAATLSLVATNLKIAAEAV